MMKRALLFLIAAAVVALPGLAGEHGSAGCCQAQTGVERTVIQLSDGVRVTLAAKDAATIEKLHSHAGICAEKGCGDCPMHAEGVTRSVEKTDTGVTITATSTDADLVAKLQQHAGRQGCKAQQPSSKSEACKPKAAHASCQHGGAANS